MGNDVFADGMEVASKKGAGKVIAAFPDVCLSPPSPPAGPVPIPYPNSSFSKDAKQGSKTVKIKNKEVMLKDQSYYKTSPLGDEAATKTLGAGVVSHVITGKTYFVAWSMDVKFEGENVDRHVDMTTSNHASPMANASLPWANISEAALADAATQCRCCGGAPHSTGEAMNGRDWYAHRAEVEGPRKPRKKKKKADVPGQSVADKQRAVEELLVKAERREGCACPPGTKVLPEDPCNVFYGLPPKPDPVTEDNHLDRSNLQSAMKKAIDDIYRGPPGGTGGIRQKVNQKRVEAGLDECERFNHLVPKAAGGCPGTEDGGNLQCKDDLCPVCKKIDEEFNKYQTINFPESSASP